MKVIDKSGNLQVFDNHGITEHPISSYFVVTFIPRIARAFHAPCFSTFLFLQIIRILVKRIIPIISLCC